MELDANEREQLGRAVSIAYGFEELARFLDYKLGMDIEDFSARGTGKREVVRLLLLRANQQGWSRRLLDELRRDTTNPELIDVLERMAAPNSARSTPSRILIPPLESDMVYRPSTVDAILQLVSEAMQLRPPYPVTIHGPGGFGKTFLANQVCHDSRTTTQFDTILWVETGQDCTPARIVQLIADLCVHLGVDRPALTDPDQAGFHLAQVLGDRRVLLVVDNVWSAKDLLPFLMGGPGCLRLITTRNARVCPSYAKMLHLGGMMPHEISELLRRSVRKTQGVNADELAQLCGGWPLLASVLGANLDEELAAGAAPQPLLEETRSALMVSGPGAFDVLDSSQRLAAISQVMRSSIQSLEEHVSIGGDRRLQDKYLDLGIFPASTPIPLDVLAVWWHHDYGWSEGLTRQFCKILADRSLVDSYRADSRVIFLHDVFRAYLRNALGERWRDRHQALVQSFAESHGGNWADLPERYAYMWQHLSHHMVEAGLSENLIRLLSDGRYIVTKASRFGDQALVTDRSALASIEDPPSAGDELYPQWLTASVFTGSAHLLYGLSTPTDIAATLLALLIRSGADVPALRELREVIRAAPSGLETLWVHGPQALEGSVSGGHVGAVTAVCCGTSAWISGGEDGTVRTWDATERQLRGVFYGHTGWVFAVEMSPDEEIIASAGDDSVIRLRQRASGRITGLLMGHQRRIRSLAFVSTGRLLVSGAEDGRVCVWDVARQELVRDLATPGTPVWSVSVSSDDQVVAVAGEDEFVRLFDLNSGVLLDERAAHSDWVRSVSFARWPESRLLVSGSGDKTVRLWNASGGRLAAIRALNIENFRPRSVRLYTESHILAADENAVIHMWGEAGLVARAPMPAGVDWVRSIAVTDDGSAVLAGCEDGGVRIWQPHDGKLVDVGRGANAVWSTAFGSQGNTVSPVAATEGWKCWTCLPVNYWQARRSVRDASGRWQSRRALPRRHAVTERYGYGTSIVRLRDQSSALLSTERGP